MLETMLAFRKNKIELSDYNYQQDVENRHLMSQFSLLDVEVLEEILYSSLTIPIEMLSKNLELNQKKLHPILEKLQQTGLFSLEGSVIHVDKEMRKYYEGEIHKFDENFKPNMEYLQGLLRKVPMHSLLSWYNIPRSSNNIFDSLIEKYFLTPQIFQRHLMDLNFNDSILNKIVEDVYQSKDLEIAAKDLIEKYEISHKQLQELILQLEFHFACCLIYKRQDNSWVEVVTPFYEWRQYLLFLRSTDLKSIKESKKIDRAYKSDFAFVEALSDLLLLAQKQPLKIISSKSGKHSLDKKSSAALHKICSEMQQEIPFLISKALHFKLAEITENKLSLLEAAKEWLKMDLENRALHLHRHLFNRLECPFPPELCNERSIREAEKSIHRILYSGWVYFEDFFKGISTALKEYQAISLKRSGRIWKYQLPIYSEEEKEFIKAIIFEWLFYLGITATGLHEGKECFCVTAFGQSIFA